MILVNLFAVSALLISYLSVTIDPALFWPPAFFGLAYPFILLINILFCVFWIVQLRWWFGLSLITILSGYSYLKKTISFRDPIPVGQHAPVPMNTPADSTGIHSFRLMTYNAHFFRRFDGPLISSVKSEMLRMIKNEQPDIICIQEYFSRRKGAYAIRDSINRILHSRHFFCHAADSNQSESMGIAIFSKFPLSNGKFISLSADPTSVNGAISADVQLPGKVVRIFSLQLQSIRFDPSDYKFLDRIKNQINPDMESSRHIGQKLKWAFVLRSAQAKIIAARIAESPFAVAVCGDFNDPPVSYAVETISKNLKNCFEEKGSGFARTYNGSFPNFQIDYILCSSLFNVVDYHIIKKELSDHYPVVSDLSYH